MDFAGVGRGWVGEIRSGWELGLWLAAILVVRWGNGVGDGVPMGVVKPGEVILWAIALGAATDRKLMATVVTIGTKNNTNSVKIRLEPKLILDMCVDARLALMVKNQILNSS